ncbi:efflux RND transporter periplasmic adaptor subunit [Meridianimarinicoccus roseus]|uniref:Efflux RND transporter periplasmic adaptor subunit n=1 Tax=Meridianimarinicoccus roseus TaxID=2072018 RepID=A0A2V2LA65_9RHOB|nr:efflux RND transporter periplasmic adaptor subunit [Meridianimarinicoccus roseus]PWR02350.1 efflux RND transporter periplasmic adaptor subunit [Meridianimarinicoccus roseus]
MRGRYTALAILALAGGTAGGITLERFYLNPANRIASEGPEILYWVAPMDPNFRQPGPGKSPMGMDLIPVYAGQEPSGDPVEVSLSAAEINAIGVRTALARVTDVAPRIETVGFVGYDEHRTSHVHTRVEGWIERLDVRAVGDRVERGQVLFDLFSPLVAAATGDLIRAVEDGDPRILDAARNKLLSHGMSTRQIAEIEATGQLARNVEIEAPQDGVVIALDAADGMYLQPGTRAFSIADLSRVWLIVDVFERDMARLSEDMTATARFEHLPGRVFEGRIDYIYPELDPRTRTLPVRLRFDNSDGLLRPGMFGTVSLEPQTRREVLTVPSEAVIRTGAAERVILRTGEGTFRPRLVTTGLRDSFGEGGRTEILQGLAPGEEVVASAQFLIDSESALNAGFTRMAPTDEEPARGTGTLVSLDRDRRIATLRHDVLESLDWPAMTSEFPVRADVALDRLHGGEEVAFRAARGADGLIGLIELGPDDGVAATGTGIALGVTPEGRLTLDHGPIPDLGWPAMRMDLDVAGIDPAEVPLDTPIEFDLARGEGGMFSIIAVRAEGEDASPVQTVDEAPPSAPPIVVSGTIDAVDPATRQATITHGPIAEIGMPGMTMDFAIDSALDLAALETGREMTLTFARPDGMTMLLAEAEAVEPPMEVTGTINAVDTEARTANVTHGPMIEIGMPGMTMDFAIGDSIDPASLATGEDLTLLLRRNPDLSMTLVGTAAPRSVSQ